MQYASIIIDAVLRGDDAVSRPQVFDYAVPASLGDRLQRGHMVRVPFGSRMTRGFVVDLKAEADSPRPRDIRDMVSDVRYLSSADLDLADWVASQYLCSPVHVLRAMLPPGFRDGTGPPTVRRLVVNVDDIGAAEEELGRAKKQAAALREAAELGEPVSKMRLAQLAGVSTSTVDALVRGGYLRWVEVRDGHRPYDRAYRHDPPEALTPDQRRALEQLYPALDGRGGRFLLYGVTSSGKTEVYLRVMERCLARGRGAILMVPEISLTPQMVARVKGRLGDGVAVLHSAMSPGERAGEWHRLFSGEAAVALGPRSAVFAPVRNLGVIIVDEEHETAYKQESVPRYHARDVALRRAAAAGATVILGSATPCLETYHAVELGDFRMLRLPARIDGRPMPGVEVVDMRREWAHGNHSIFSRRLHRALEQGLDRGEQTVLFLNQRGYSSFLVCMDCGHTFRCSRCNVTLTYHREGGVLRCHYCNDRVTVPRQCPECGGRVVRRGVGTQKVEAAAASAFPGARIARLDTDTARRRDARSRIYEQFARGELDILVGTQMIAKGWDIPAVTLVGVVDADTALHFPDFRSSERTFQLLTQVSGRAGRGERPGRVIIQTASPDHPAIAGAAAGDLEGFYDRELAERRRAQYPPYVDLVRLVVTGDAEPMVQLWADELRRRLEGLVGGDGREQLLGPAPAPLDRLRGQYRWHLLLKTSALESCLDGLREVMHNMRMGREDPHIIVDVNPVQML
ncbi:MAG: primosomal protein N' [Bacillota bacterium]